MKKESKLTRLITSLINRIDQQFLYNFVGGEVRIRKGKEYLFQGGIKSIKLKSGNPKVIAVEVSWLAQPVRPILMYKDPLSRLDSSHWLLHPCGAGYEMPIDVVKVDTFKNNTKKVLVVLGFDGERTRFIPPDDPLCIAKEIGIVKAPMPEGVLVPTRFAEAPARRAESIGKGVKDGGVSSL